MNIMFVSSTFRDMYAERDIIHNKVVPLVNVTAEKYGESVWCKDLRWGINTTDLSESERHTKVLNVCLDEIDRSKPPFIILVGERYGWIPDRNFIRSEAVRKHMDLESLEISVTALEIEYGVFCRKYTPIVYFREASGNVPEIFRSEDREHFKKLEALKERLRRLCGPDIRTYRVRFDGKGPRQEDLDAFAALLHDDICRIMQPQWEKFSRLSPRQKELAFQNNYIGERVRQYACASEDEEKLYQLLVKAASDPRGTIAPYKGLYLYQNDEGTGKSMLAARLVQRLRRDEKNVVLAFTVGCTPASSVASELLKSEVYALESYVHMPHLEESGESAGQADPEYRDRLEFLCDYLADNDRRIFIIVDGVERLQPGKDRDGLVFLPGSGRSGIAMLLTARREFAFPFGETVEPAMVTFRERQFVVNGLLEYYGKQLSEQVKFALIQKSRRGGLLYISMMLKRLLQMGKEDFEEIHRRGKGIDAINAYQEELIANSPESTVELGRQIMEMFGRAINPELTREICGLLSLSPFGLRESDLEAIIGERYNALDFAALMHSWEECFLITSDGRIMIQIESVACGCLEYVKDYRGIFNHLKRLSPRDDFCRRYLLFFAQQAFELTDADVLRHLMACLKEDSSGDALGGESDYVKQAAYALWRGRVFGNGKQITDWIRIVQYMAEADLRYLPVFLDLWRIFMAAADFYRTDPAYVTIVTTYREAAASLNTALEGRFGERLDMRVNDCYRVLADYYSNSGDEARAEENRRKYLETLGDPFHGAETDKDEIAVYLATLVSQLNEYAVSLRKSGDQTITERADPIRNRLLELCRDVRVKADFPAEALLGLLSVQEYAAAAAGLRGSDFSVFGEVEELIRQHPALMEDDQIQIGLAGRYTAEASRLSRALKGEKIPEDRRRQALSYSFAAQELYGKMIQNAATPELCMMLAGQKLNTARLLEQEGSEAALRAALQELIEGAGAIDRLEKLPEKTPVDPMFGFTLYNRMGIVASEIGGEQMWGIMETAWDNTMVYSRGIPDSARNLLILEEMFHNQAEILERTGQKKHLQMAELRLSLCEEILKHLTSKDILRQLPFEERRKLTDWRRENVRDLKRVRKKMR